MYPRLVLARVFFLSGSVSVSWYLAAYQMVLKLCVRRGATPILLRRSGRAPAGLSVHGLGWRWPSLCFAGSVSP